MAQVTIELPDEMITFLERRAAAAGFDGVGPYLVSMALEELDVTVRSLDELHVKLQESIDSGSAAPMTTEDWNAIRREGRALLQTLKAQRP